MQATFNEITFSDSDVVNPGDFIPSREYNPHRVRPWLIHDHGYTVAIVFASCEQEPNRDSRVTLTNDLDAMGMPRLEIQWRLSELTGRTIRLLAHSAKLGIERLGFGAVQLDDWVDGTGWSDHVDDHFHHMGTTRMADAPTRGVVDRDCAVHGVQNLYVASSSVFPTSGFSNPTLTILALAVRLADRLKRLSH